MKIFHILSLICLLGLSVAEKARWDNYQVWSLAVSNDDQLGVLQEIELKPDGVSFTNFSVVPLNIFDQFFKKQYSLWGSPNHVGKFIEIVVPPHKLGDFMEMVRNYDFKNKILTSNLQRFDLFDSCNFLKVFYKKFVV